MTTLVDVVNRALQTIGTRTTITAAQLADNLNNEAKQANLVLANCRDDLLRMAPWNCAKAHINLVYITSSPGTVENPTTATELWQPGQPAPPWAYEYQYPADCLRPCWIIPGTQAGVVGVPITTAVTGFSNSFNGPPVRYAVATDKFYPVTAAVVVAGGTGYAIGDYITLEGTPDGDAPIGAPAVLQVATLSGSAVATVTVMSQVYHDSDTGTDSGGSYFAKQTGTIAQGSTTGAGTGATFSLTFGAQSPQRVILTNQPDAIMAYVSRVTDPNVMDTLFQSAWISVLASKLAIALTGDKQLANGLINRANADILEARKADGNEGLTINDWTPDWIRGRGYSYPDIANSPISAFDWGPLWSAYA